MDYYLRAFEGRFVVLGVVVALGLVAVAAFGVRDVRGGGTWASYLTRVGPRLAFALLAVAAGVATLTPLGTGQGRALDLVPLRAALAAGMTATTPTQIAGNLGLLLWMGLLLPLVSRRCRTVLRATVVVAATSVVIETSQYVLALGRFSTVDDVLLNTLGGALGAVVGVTWARRRSRARSATPAVDGPAPLVSRRRG